MKHAKKIQSILPYILATLVAGLGIGLLLALLFFPKPAKSPIFPAFSPEIAQGETSGSHMNMAQDHDHGAYDFQGDIDDAPSFTLEAERDSMSGINLHIVTHNFTFTPEVVNEDPVENTGHAHLYINGTKFGRVYSEWFYIPQYFLNDEGFNTLCVTLNANNHDEYMVAGKPLYTCIER
ncbi:hypothetical protein H6776_00380 [Candidatus Nomurabacteria bacterium]|nr:hypothetical protein [Candidatus Nomurabacteria bacterium]